MSNASESPAMAAASMPTRAFRGNVQSTVEYYEGTTKMVRVQLISRSITIEEYNVPEGITDRLDVMGAAIVYANSKHIYMNFFVDIYSWFRNHRSLSYYIVLTIGSSLVIGGAILTAFIGPVGLILTAVGGVLIAQLAPAVRGNHFMAINEVPIDGELVIKNNNEDKSTITFNKGNIATNQAGYIKIGQDTDYEIGELSLREGQRKASWGAILEGRPRGHEKSENIIRIGSSYEPYEITLDKDKLTITRKNRN